MEDKQIKLEVLEVGVHPEARIIKFEGDLDSTNVEVTLDLVTSLLNEGVTEIIADFAKLRYVNSTGLGILLHINKMAKERNGHFKIAKVNENVFEIIEIIGANTLLDIYDELEDAIQSLN